MTDSDFNWSKFISVDDAWVAKTLIEHCNKNEEKTVLRVYTLTFAGQKYETINFVSLVGNSIKRYVLSDDEIKSLEARGEEAFIHARDYFGPVDPTYDGKYGELILYLLTEAILKVPLIAYKIPTNPKDQIKGGDGVFFGDYNGVPALFIGEAKTWRNFKKALKDAFESLDKLYKEADSTAMTFEFFVAKRNMRSDLSKQELDYLFNCFSPGTTEYENRNKVHPVLIIYDDSGIAEINAANKNDGESKLRELMATRIDGYLSSIAKLRQDFKEVGEVNLDFFLIPLKNVDEFKKALYKKLHGVDYAPAVRKRSAEAKGSETKGSKAVKVKR